MATSVDDSDDLDNELDNELDDELADYQPEDLAEPILPEPVREDFFDAKYPNRLQQIVSDKIYNKRDDLRSTKKYRYTPLGENQIRLVLLQPGEEKDPIKCKVLYKRLDDPQVAKRYFALSYHWGTDEPMNDIWIIDPRVDPRSESRPNILLTKQNKFASFVSQLKEQKPNDEWWFLVRDNLYNALRALRRHMMANAKDKEKAKMLIYIDAICINQDPIDEGAKIEKRQQVSKMAQIYNTARSVCIWLGEGNDATETAMPFIKKIVKDMPNLDSYLNDEESFSKWMAFKDLMTYKWFSRRWVVQEVALARKATVHCGNETIDWNDFADGVALFVNKKDLLLKPSSTPENSRLQLGDVAALGANVLVTAISNLLRKTEEGDVQKHLVGIETLVSTLLFFEASNPHDYIYSLVAIARDTPKKYGTHPESELEDAPFDIEVNYDNDPIDLFRLFTKLCVRSSESLDIICRHWAPDVEDRDEQGSTKDATFPTWILKVSDSSYGTALDTLQGRRAGDSLVGCPYRDMRKTYNAANSTKAIFIFGGLPPDDRPSRQNTRETISSEDSFSTAHLIKEKSWDDLPLLGIGKLDFARSTRILSRRASFNDRFRQLTPRFTASPRPQSPHAESSISHIAPGINLQNLLHVKGVKLGQIKKRSNPLTAGMVPSSWLEVAGWNRKNPGLVPDMLWRTLIADRGPDGHFPPRWYRRACSHCLSDASTKDYLDTSITPSSEILAQFLNRVRSVVYNRQFFAGGEGREPLFGLAPGTALKGDVVCVLAGCTVPVILRKDSGVYKFIGEAYVYGKMDGEAMAGYTHWDQDQLEEELNWFTMC